MKDFYENHFYKYIPHSHSKLLLGLNYIISIKEYFAEKLDTINYKIISPEENIKFNQDEKEFLNLVNNQFKKVSKKRFNLKKKGNTQIIKPNLKDQSEVFSCLFKNVRFIGLSGILIYNGYILLESAFSLLRLNLTKKFFGFVTNERTMKGRYTSIMHWDYGNNYYHFLIDNLPRLYTILKINESKINFIVPEYYDKFYLDIIKLFLDERFKIIKIKKDEIWNLESFCFASFCTVKYSSHRGFIPKMYIDFVKNTIFEKLGIKRALTKKRIYISRKKAERRKILNENELVNILKKYNFEIICTEDMSFKEEVELFNSAEIVVGATGAGLVNIIFSKNIIVLEIHSPKYIIPHYFMLCKTLGFSYNYAIGYSSFKNQDFYFNPQTLEKILITIIRV